MKSNYNITGRLVCETCGGENFEFNEDKSYVKCAMCNREYLGGYDELVAFNQPNIDDAIQQKANEIADDAMNEILKAFKGSKNIKLE